MEDRLDLLGRVPLFVGVDREGLQAIAEAAEEIDAPAGTTLAHEGRYEGYFYVVESGTVRIDRGGIAKDDLGPGAFFGELALLDAGPRTATATAITTCRLLRIDNQRFEDLIDGSDSVRAAIASEGGRRLQRIDDEAPA
jgi:CRP/FNR family cyclic AMP-dependent transcriptional regulator